MFNYNVTKCVVSFIIGLVLFLAGLYSRVGPPEEAQAEEATRIRGAAVTAGGG